MLRQVYCLILVGAVILTAATGCRSTRKVERQTDTARADLSLSASTAQSESERQTDTSTLTIVYFDTLKQQPFPSFLDLLPEAIRLQQTRAISLITTQTHHTFKTIDCFQDSSKKSVVTITKGKVCEDVRPFSFRNLFIVLALLVALLLLIYSKAFFFKD